MEKYQLRREVPVEDGYDLVVAGGGPAGTAAALSAARLGAKVLLVEALGCLGGTGTSGLVTLFEPLANGDKMLAGGIVGEIVRLLIKRGFVPDITDEEGWKTKYHTATPLDPEGLKLILDELTAKAGVEVRYFTRVIDADVNAETKELKGVIISNVEGYRYIKARAFVDGTGDAVLADLAGAKCYEAGRDTPHIMPPTLCAFAAGIKWDDTTTRGQQEKVEQAIADGFFSQPDRHVPGLFRGPGQLGLMNTGHVFNMNSLNCRSLSDGLMKGRIQVQEYADFYRKYLGLKNLQVVTTAALMGIRESRRIQGEYMLNYEDYKARRQFPDQIGIFAKTVDIHVYDCTEEEYKRYFDEFTKIDKYRSGECYGIPYGVLVPKGWKNLWVAGRCASSDIKVQGSLRVQPPAYMMGEAAGAAAMQAIRTGKTAQDLDTAKLVATLRNQGAILPQEKLTGEMTRN